MSFELLAYILTAVIALAGGGVLGFAGFGAGLFMAPLLTLVLPPKIAVPLMILVGFSGTARLVPGVYRQARVRTAMSMAIPAMIFLPIGVFGLKSLDGEIVRRIVSGVVLIMVFVLARGVRFQNADRLAVLIPMGMLSGLLTGIGSVGGPPVVVTFLSIDDPPRVTRANLIVCLATSGVAAIAVLFLSGVLSRQVAELLVPALPAFFIGTFVGSKLFDGASESSYRPIVLAFLAIVALVGLLWPV